MWLIDEDDGDGRSSLEAWARKSEDYKRVTAMIRLAASEPVIPVLPEDPGHRPVAAQLSELHTGPPAERTNPGTAAQQVRPDHQTLADGLRPGRHGARTG